MIDVGICEKDGLDWRAAERPGRVQAVKPFDLLTDIGAGIDQVPADVVGGHGARGLGPRLSAERTRPETATIVVVTVPPREPSARP